MEKQAERSNSPESVRFEEELAKYGPEAPARRAPDLEESLRYCRSLAKNRYENFHVASWLLPRALRPHFHAVYAYCRWSDDLADEVADSARATRLLEWWEAELNRCPAGDSNHPVFVALRATLREFGIPLAPLQDLLSAFRQDQSVSRYETFESLRDYCRRSADPVGRLVLYLGRRHEEDLLPLSDSICTGLQLINFCQDVANDWRRGRIYLPGESLRKFGVSEMDFAAEVATPAFRELLAFEVARAEEWLRQGLPLVDRMLGSLRGDIWLFAQGGLAIAKEIRSIGFDVWTRRPTVSKWKKLVLLTRALLTRPSRQTAGQRGAVYDA